MRGPAQKEFDPVVSPLFIGTVHDQLRKYDGRRVGDERPCPRCQSTELRRNGYQRSRKTVARLITESGFETVGVEVQQFECKECGRSFQGDLSELFYDRCEYARPIVDLCRFHAGESSYNDCERTLQRVYGLQVDRDTIKRYDERFDDHSEAGRAIEVGDVRMSLSFLAFLFGEDLSDSPHVVLQSHTALW